jgi:protein TonB
MLAPGDRLLGTALGVSLALHAVALAVHFKFPEAIRWKAENQPLEVVLVNASTRERPAKADVLAQANLDRGGNVDEPRRAKTPLPVTHSRAEGKDLADAQRRVQQLEAQQERLLAQAKESERRVPAEPPKSAPAPEAPPVPNGRDLADLSLAAMRLQAQIDRQIDDYQKRPRKKFIGANAREYRFAQYEEDWRVKVERVGTLNYRRKPAASTTATFDSRSPSGPTVGGVHRARSLLGPEGSRRGRVQDRPDGKPLRPPSRPTSAATPTSSSSPAPGSSARATRSGRRRGTDARGPRRGG